MRKTISFAGWVLLSSMFISQFALAVDTVMPFKDVPKDAYFYTPVQIGLEEGILKSGKKFYPARPLTRAEFIDWTVKAIGVEKVMPATPSFSDVPKTFWAYSSIETAKKFGLASGTQKSDGTPTGKFEPKKLVNRAEAAVMLMKAFTQVQEGSASFPDIGAVSWANSAIKKAAVVNFFSGNQDGTFRPANNINRAEGITVLRRVIEKLDTNELTLSFAPPTPIAPVGGPVNTYTDTELLQKIGKALPGYIAGNIKQAGSYAVFFAFNNESDDGSPYGWYRLSLQAANPKAESIFTDTIPLFFLYSNGAVSPDGKDFLYTSSVGKVAVLNIATLAKTELGVFTTDDGENRYMYPGYTPDGKYMIFFDKTARNQLFDPTNGLLLVDAATKDIESGVFVPGFWLTEAGGGELEPGFSFPEYTFPDSTHLVFKDKTLNLSTMKKE